MHPYGLLIVGLREFHEPVGIKGTSTFRFPELEVEIHVLSNFLYGLDILFGHLCRQSIFLCHKLLDVA